MTPMFNMNEGLKLSVLHLHKLLRGVGYRNQYIFGLCKSLREPQENSEEPCKKYKECQPWDLSVTFNNLAMKKNGIFLL